MASGVRRGPHLVGRGPSDQDRRSARMSRFVAAITALVVGLALIAALPARVSEAAGEMPGCPEEPTDPDAIIQVEAGQQFVIVLAANHTTGFSWTVAEQPDTSVAQVVSDDYLPSGGPPGAGGRECWVFLATGPGETQIGMIYRRPFDPPGTPPGRTATFNVDVSQTSAGPGTTPVTPPSFAAFAGGWSRRGFGLTIGSDGTGTATWRIYRWCSDDPTPACDSMEGDAIVPGGRATLAFTSTAGGAVATGQVTESNDEQTLAAGPVNLLLLQYGVAVLSQGSSAMVLCSADFQQAPMAVQQALPCGA